MTDRELMQQALDALHDARDYLDIINTQAAESKARRITKLMEALRARLAQPEPEPESNESDEIAHLQNELHLLAREMFYRGNSVAYIHNKMMAYRSGIDAAWNALRANGIHPDGSTSLSEAIAKHTAPPRREWQGLTDERIGELERKYLFSGKNGEAPEEFDGEMGYWAVYRAIEAELRRTNT